MIFDAALDTFSSRCNRHAVLDNFCSNGLHIIRHILTVNNLNSLIV